MLKLKLQYFCHPMRRTNSFEKTLMLGKTEGGRRGRQRMSWLDGITDSMDMTLVNSGSWWWTGRTGVLQSMGSQKVGHDWVTELKLEGGVHLSKNVSHQHFTHDVIRALIFLCLYHSLSPIPNKTTHTGFPQACNRIYPHRWERNLSASFRSTLVLHVLI